MIDMSTALTLSPSQTVILGTMISRDSSKMTVKSANAVDKRALRRLASGFFLNGKVMYKRSHDGILLRCVDALEANEIMSKIREEQCGSHMSGFMLARKLSRYSYYWFTMESDCFKHVKNATFSK